MTTLLRPDGSSHARPSRDQRPLVRSKLRRSLYAFTQGVICSNQKPNLMDAETFKESCDWVQRKIIAGRKRIWMGDPRGHMKSTRFTESLPAWLSIQRPHKDYDLPIEFERYERLIKVCGILKGPDTRILIASATKPNAQDFVLQARRIYEGNTLFRWAFPELCPEAHPPDFKYRWSSECVDLPGRTMNYGEGTFNAGSPDATETKYHYNFILGDDFIHEGNYQSVIESRAAVSWWGLAESLLDNQDVSSPLSSVIIGIGNFWTHFDLRSHIESHLKDDYDIWHRSCWECSIHGKGNCPRDQLCVPTKKPIWNIKFSQAGLEAQRRRQGEKIFSAQMENNPVDPSSVAFKAENLYDNRLDTINGVIHVYDFESTNLVKKVNLAECWFFMILDPATSDDPQSCRNALLVCAEDQDGMVHLIDGWAEQIKSEKAIPKLLDTWASNYRQQRFIKTVGIEGNAGQRWAITALCFSAKDRSRNPDESFLSYLSEPPNNPDDDHIISLKPDRGVSKLDRISNGLGARTLSRKLSLGVHVSFRDVFLYEYKTFPSSKSLDLVDAAAYIDKVARGNMEARQAMEANMLRYRRRKSKERFRRGGW